MSSDESIKKGNGNQLEFYQNILRSNGIEDQIKSFETVDAGEHCTSRCSMLTVQFVNEETSSLQLFVKKARSVQEKEDIEELFEKEVLFYNSLVPDLNRFGQQILGLNENDEPLMKNVVPKAYYADIELIVMESLASQNYKMLPEVECHPLMEAKKSMEALAHFHAPTYAYIQEIGLETCIKMYPFVKRSMSWSSKGDKVIGSWVDRIIKGAIRILKSHPVEGSDPVYQHLLSFQESAFTKLCRHYELDTKNLPCGVVLNHGDGWNCNFLFQRQDEKADIEHCIILDFQSIYLGSPSLDLQYYLFVTAKTDVRRQYWKSLLKIYYDTFLENVEKLKGDIQFSFEDLVNDFRDRCETGFILGLDPFYFFDTFGESGDLDEIEGTDKGDYYAQGIVDSFEEYRKLIMERD